MPPADPTAAGRAARVQALEAALREATGSLESGARQCERVAEYLSKRARGAGAAVTSLLSLAEDKAVTAVRMRNVLALATPPVAGAATDGAEGLPRPVDKALRWLYENRQSDNWAWHDVRVWFWPSGPEHVERAALAALAALELPATPSGAPGHLEHGATVWRCPRCHFGFDAAHVDEPEGGYSCPQCVLDEAKREADTAGTPLEVPHVR